MTAPSRYDNGVTIISAETGGVPVIGVLRSPAASAQRFLHYQTGPNDRLDNLAYRFYQDPTLWWVIADANPELLYPDPLVPGSILRIPQA